MKIAKWRRADCSALAPFCVAEYKQWLIAGEASTLSGYECIERIVLKHSALKVISKMMKVLPLDEEAGSPMKRGRRLCKPSEEYISKKPLSWYNIGRQWAESFLYEVN
ncbi:hypothetical protein NDS46_15555 [Paenibacillus thiaminolyticus]|uniref:hypothetical protein n=1 Tax=Paenibacillus thiaminolyticus TaxID=49283 RepID=UPI0023305F9F|nr:hypothetical protein [Paenibacillus thiaminolyticus]WCF05810.1 hypothetical protein NDS46_15555 [Paenibacillus thiaminolyticus]